MKNQIEQIRLKLIEKLENTLTVDAFQKIEMVLGAEFTFNPRMRTAAGRAIYSQNLIELNKELLERHPEHLEQVVAHEMAHLIAYALFGPRQGAGHGMGWKRTMRMLGFPAARCHSLNVSNKKRPHKIQAYAKCNCKNGLFAIKTKLYNKIKAGKKYRCSKCRTPLTI